MSKNLDLWDAVSKTDPANTKRMEYGAKLTAIDAYSQIMAATSQFGSVGTGWGWDIINFQYPPNDTIIVQLRMWHGDRKNTFDVCGQAQTHTKGQDPKPDADCAKKAVTDAITKGLSYLGFNADVFMGKFDDNKYVESLKANGKPSTNDPAGVTKIKDRWRKMFATLESVKNEEELDKLVRKGATLMNDLQKNIPDWHKTALGNIKAKRDSFKALREADEADANLGAG